MFTPHPWPSPIRGEGVGAPRCLTPALSLTGRGGWEAPVGLTLPSPQDVERVINPQIYSDGDSLTAAGMAGVSLTHGQQAA